MDATSALTQLAEQPALDAVAEPLSQAVRGAYEAIGAAGERAKNAAHGHRGTGQRAPILL
jgi:hypothetical protein